MKYAHFPLKDELLCTQRLSVFMIGRMRLFYVWEWTSLSTTFLSLSRTARKDEEGKAHSEVP